MAIKVEAKAEQLIALFNELFRDSYKTVLVAGEGEPEYLPADAEHPYHRVIFAHGFFASALHEIAHWCVAGQARRELVDFGYWYKPDGRTEQEQREFEQVEVKPQAYEWIFSVASNHRFHFSADNLSAAVGASDQFKQGVQGKVLEMLSEGLAERPAALVKALQDQFEGPELLADRQMFSLMKG